MNLKRVLLASSLFCLLCQPPARAENWVHVSTHASGGEVFVDLDSLDMFENVVAVWVLAHDAYGNEESLARIGIECENSFWALIEVYEYSPDTYANYHNDIQAVSIPPGSIISHVSDYVCAYMYPAYGP